MRQEQHEESAPVVCLVVPSIDGTILNYGKVYATRLDKSKSRIVPQIQTAREGLAAFWWQLLLTRGQALLVAAFWGIAIRVNCRVPVAKEALLRQNTREFTTKGGEAV